jgi:hypothetical protein
MRVGWCARRGCGALRLKLKESANFLLIQYAKHQLGQSTCTRERDCPTPPVTLLHHQSALKDWLQGLITTMRFTSPQHVPSHARCSISWASAIALAVHNGLPSAMECTTTGVHVSQMSSREFFNFNILTSRDRLPVAQLSWTQERLRKMQPIAGQSCMYYAGPAPCAALEAEAQSSEVEIHSKCTAFCVFSRP